MKGLNKAMIIGNLGSDPEIRYMPSGGAVCNFSVATTETWKDKATGEKQEKTEWHNVVGFGRLAEVMGEYLSKGSTVFIEGQLQTRKWEGQDGQTHYKTEIVAKEMQMIGGRGNNAPRQSRQSQPEPSAQQSFEPEDNFDDDVPF